jgi:DNA-binding protein YbaB
MERQWTQQRLDPSALLNIAQELEKTVANMADVQKQILGVTGVAWSDDRMVKALVGPRGQLVDLEIDPRVYRRPNSKALAASIVATVRAAVEQAAAKTQSIMDENMPMVKDLIRPGLIDGVDMRKLISSSDADLEKMGRENDDGDVP